MPLNRTFFSTTSLKSTVGMLLAAVCATTISSQVSAVAQGQDWEFKVNGKRVARNVYDAALLLNESTKLIKNNCTERAVGKLKRAILLAPDLPEPHTNLAVLLARQGKLEEAKKHLLKATDSSDAPDLAFLNLATLYQTTGELDKAISVYEIYTSRTDDKGTKAALDLLRNEKAHRATTAGNTASNDYLEQSSFHGWTRWSESRMPLKIYVEPPQTDDEEPSGYKETYGNILRQSFYDWSKVSNNKIRFVFTPNERVADIKCHWTNDPQFLGGGAEAGETRFKCVSHAMVTADIYLRTKEEQGAFPYTDNAVKGTCLHEIGHALGISGHSLMVSDIMFFSTPFVESERHLSSRDRNTLLRLYDLPFDFWSWLLDLATNQENYTKWCIVIPGVMVVLLPLVMWLASLRRPKQKGKGKKKR